MLRPSQITPEERRIPKRKFMIMGFLDALVSRSQATRTRRGGVPQWCDELRASSTVRWQAQVMQIFGTTKLNGSLVVLLQQAAIPVRPRTYFVGGWLIEALLRSQAVRCGRNQTL